MKVYVAGHQGMVGAAFVRRLKREQGIEVVTRTRKELDLTNQAAVQEFLAKEKPDAVFIAAAKVGGIMANNTYPAEFIYQNLAIATNVIHGSYQAGVKRLLFLGSSCIYPKHAPQPMTEDCLLTSPLEPTNEAYAIAKIAGLKMCQYYRKQYGVLYHSAMPTNLYGPGDNYHPQNSHVMPAMIRRFHEAKLENKPEVVLWGTGKPMREFMHVDDLADACYLLMQASNPPDIVNMGTGTDVTIRELAETVSAAVGYQGKLTWDTTKPDGTPRKLLDVSRLANMGFKAKVSLAEGVKATYAAFLKEQDAGILRSV